MAPTTRQSMSGSISSRAPVLSRAAPRRKTSASHSSRRDEVLDVPEGILSEEHEDMAIDDSAISRHPPTAELLHPLRDMAERVGREVEMFAEKLDAWKPVGQDDAEAKRRSAAGLIDDLKAIAQDTVSRLAQQHGAERKRQMRKVLARLRRRSEAAIEHDPSINGESDENQEMQPDPRAKTTLQDLEQWQAELQTWDLLQRLIGCQYPDHAVHSEEDEARRLAFGNDNDRFLADGASFARFLGSSDIARERLVVLRWLEASAEQTDEDIEIIEEQLENASGKGKSLFSSGWLDTKEKIKGEKRLRLWDTPIDSGLPTIQNSSGSDLLVTQLDLDAATRQDRTLENPDRHFESSFWMMCWEMLRRGRSMDDIHEWCAERNEVARALSIGAFPMDGHAEETRMSAESRLRWRQACCALAQTGGLTTHERAVYGLLSGDFKSVERICADWNDHLFASYNSVLIEDYQQYLAEQDAEQTTPQHNELQASSDTTYGLNASSAAQKILAGLQLKTCSHLGAEQPFKLIQAGMIGHNVADFVVSQGVALSRQTRQRDTESYSELVPATASDLVPDDHAIDAVTDDPNALRVLAHIVIIFQELGMDFGSDERFLAVENVICAYINFLRLAGKINLIPLYVSRLTKERASIAMARVLPDINNSAEREGVMNLMKEFGLNVPEILRTQYEFAMDFSALANCDDDQFEGIKLLESVDREMWPGQRIKAYDPRPLELNEEILVRSMEWILLLDGHWAMAFSLLTDVAKRFLNSGRVDAVLALYRRLPFTEVSRLGTKALLGKAMDVMDEHEGSDDEKTPPLRRSSRTRPFVKADRQIRSATPHRSKVYRDLLKTHATNYHEIGQLVAALEALWNWRATEDAHLEREGHEISSLKRASKERMDDLNSAMEPLLHDFLQRPGNSATAEDLRKIRRYYLPESILAYVSALQCAGHLLSREHLLQSMDLVTDVADNEELIDCFKTTGRMAELVDAFATTSKAMLRLNEDSASKGTRKRPGKMGRNLGMWEISV